jgi:hypothetical protein
LLTTPTTCTTLPEMQSNAASEQQSSNP